MYIGPGNGLTGSARLVQEAKDQAEALAGRQAIQARQRELAQEEASLKVQADAISARLANIEAERKIVRQDDQHKQELAAKDRKNISIARKAN